MTVLSIVTVPAPILEQKTVAIERFDVQLHTLLDDMAQTMYRAHGIGLAAPQVGHGIRVAVVDVSEEKNQLREFVNPRITNRSGVVESDEGCLSIPDYRETIERSREITVEYVDRFGEKQSLHADGLLAICLQHEIDHLDGVLFVHHLSRLKKQLYRRWLAKITKNKESA